MIARRGEGRVSTGRSAAGNDKSTTNGVMRVKTSNAWGLALVATAALTACGGGGSDATVTPPTASSVTIAGTAAKGVALAGATVSVKCAAGTGTATTGVDGKYTVTIGGANLPCALKVAGTDGTTFHSLLAGTGTSGSFTANLSPLTELLVAKAASATPATFYTNFASGTAPSSATVTQAIDALKALVAGVVDLTGIDPVIDALVAANGSNAGNALDAKIDKLMAVLATAQVTLAELTSAVVSNPNVPDPIKTILSPVAASCSWLRSGKYRMINPYETDPLWKAHVLEIDAVALTAKTWQGTVIPFAANSGCQFTIDSVDETNTVMVSSGGVLVVYSQSKTVPTGRHVAVGLPEQTLPASEFAGIWNVAGWDPASGIAAPGYVAQTDEATLDATGQLTAVSRCLGLAACTAGTGPFPRFVVNAASGGFDLIENGATIARAFMFKTLAGKAAFVVLANDGQFIVAMRKEALGTLPAVGTATNFREFNLNGNGTITNLVDKTNTVTAVDTATRVVTRIRAADSRVDMLTFDKPRDGLRYRAPNSCTVSGAPTNCAETVQLPLQGMGITLALSVGTNPTAAFFNVSIGKPAN